MKFDLATAIIAAIVGTVVAYLVVGNLILSDPKPFNIKTLNESVSTNLSEPDVNVFNYRALNPTVEVYVGEDCQNYDAVSNICLDAVEEE